MPIRQVISPNLSQPAVRGWCLKFIDDAGGVPNTAPPRLRNARAALDAEIAAGRLRGDELPDNVVVVGFLDLRLGKFAGDDHVFFMRRNGNALTIWDSETNGGGRGVYHSIAELVSWFGAYSPLYVGWSMVCTGRQYAEEYQLAPAVGNIMWVKGTATVTADKIFIRNAPSRDAEKAGEYTTGQSFNYDGYIVADGHVWLTYVSYSGVRRYVAEGPYDGNPDNVWVSGGV